MSKKLTNQFLNWLLKNYSMSKLEYNMLTEPQQDGLRHMYSEECYKIDTVVRRCLYCGENIVSDGGDLITTDDGDYHSKCLTDKMDKEDNERGD